MSSESKKKLLFLFVFALNVWKVGICIVWVVNQRCHFEWVIPKLCEIEELLESTENFGYGTVFFTSYNSSLI